MAEGEGGNSYFDKFVEKHSFNDETPQEIWSRCISILIGLKSEMYGCIRQKGDSIWELPHSGMLITQLARIDEYAESALTLMLTKNDFRSVEIISRTIIEASMNLRWICLESNPMPAIIGYMTKTLSHLERDTREWKKSLQGAIDADLKSAHLKKISLKEAQIANYRNWMNNNLPDGEVKKFPKSKKKLFQILNDEIGYNTIYAALCSQSHNDGEDLMNNTLMMQYHEVFSQIGVETDIPESLEEEKKNFASLMLLESFKYLLDAYHAVSKCLDLNQGLNPVYMSIAMKSRIDAMKKQFDNYWLKGN